MHKIPGVENTKEVKEFFGHWAVYHKIMRHNYLSHRQVYKILRKFLKGRFPEKRFSLLDLGCGDAEFMGKALRGVRVKNYTGVDIADAALALAKKNTRGLPCRKRFIRLDFFREILRERHADVIWMSLAFHHLRFRQKAAFFVRCKKALAPGGCFICYEPILREGKDRKDFLKRWLGYSARHWTALTKEEFRLSSRHIVKDDFPERFSTYARLAGKAGFSRVRSLYTNRAGVNKLMVFES